MSVFFRSFVCPEYLCFCLIPWLFVLPSFGLLLRLGLSPGLLVCLSPSFLLFVRQFACLYVCNFVCLSLFVCSSFRLYLLACLSVAMFSLPVRVRLPVPPWLQAVAGRAVTQTLEPPAKCFTAIRGCSNFTLLSGTTQRRARQRVLVMRRETAAASTQLSEWNGTHTAAALPMASLRPACRFAAGHFGPGRIFPEPACVCGGHFSAKVRSS